MMKLLLLLVAISSLVFLASAGCSGGDSSIYPVDYTSSFSGEATYYGAYSNGGACSLDPTPAAGTASSIFSTVAIADNFWAGSKACGMCINLTGSGIGSGASPVTGSHIVYVNNECPSCNSNGIDLGLNGDGVWQINWKAVPCPVGSTKIQFKFQGANNYYIKLQARNTRYPVYGISILQSGTYRPLVRTADNFFTAGSSVTYPLTFPLTVQVTSSTGDAVTDSIPSLVNDVLIDGTTQFPDCSGGTSGTATTTTTAKATTTTTTTAKATTTTSTTGKAATTTTTAKSTTTTTTTTGAATTGSATQTYVYTDSVVSPFEDWSWATKNPSVTSPVKVGTYSYGFVPNSYAAVYFHRTGGISKTTVASLKFWIYPPIAITTQLAFAFTVDNVGGVGSATLGSYASIPANTWTQITVPLSASVFSAYSTFDGFWVQDQTGGSSNGQVFLDDVFLVAK